MRNNNPLNLRRTSSAWLGLLGRHEVKQWDDEFCQFANIEWGIRAAAITMRTYIKKYRLNTVQSIIMRWAPPTENNTSAYLATVSAHLTFSPLEPLRWEQRDRICALLRAMAYVETGQWLFMDTVKRGYDLAVR